MIEETFEGSGGIQLFARSWKSEGPPRAVVILQHGFKAHSGLYDGPARQLAARGLAVHAMDLRGHGRSDGERYYVDVFADYVADLKVFIARARAKNPGLPVFLLGHSAGGVVACTYALENQQELAGLICESFAHEVPAPDFALTILKGLSHIAPHAHVLNLKDADFSRDPAFVARMLNDPLIPHINYAANSVAEMVRADERLKKEFPLITLPVFILHGTEDRVTKPSGSQRFLRDTGSSDKTLKLYEGYFHDLLNDEGKEQVLADVVEWIEARIPGASAQIASAGRG
ncbi:lysophospholipase [Corallococcus sp. bb12-1]|uniref:alpha/beta hydrolase n=1 Tax=Corallococcus sp. bb12-1 TaxID=2996784 RepID=UPI0022712DF5|nr:alpha/beta hydrolase [Corallococcus sp. bb12-1]MCY1047008.1 lysophospholipase [Corallococcus sp. bb12-1]